MQAARLRTCTDCLLRIRISSEIMASLHRLLQILGVAFTFFCSISSYTVSALVKGGYWPAYSYSYFPPSQINTSLYTHLYYAFAEVDSQTFQVSVSAENQKSI